MYQKVTADTYRLIRSKRTTISVEINASAAVVVRAPLRTPLYEIESFLQHRAEWIRSRVVKVQESLQVLPPLELPGSIYHRGSVMIWKGAMVSLHRWEASEARTVFAAHVSELLPRLGVSALRYSGLRLRRMRRRWGSCSYDGTIILNTSLIRVPDHCAKAVVAHELAHLVHMNHGAGFKQLVVDVYPEYRKADKELHLWTSVLENTASTGAGNDSKSVGELRQLCL